MNWRRFDTLGLRLFLLMWVALVASSLIAFRVAVPLAEPPGGRGPAPGPGQPPLPTLPSLPPGNPFQADAAAPGTPAGPPPGPRPEGGGPPALPRPVLWWDYGVRMLVIALAAALGARWLAAPMRRLSDAASALSAGLVPGRRPPPLDERHGTREVRDAAQAFNRMAQRLQEQFDARGLHMAATSHDLRTPLTRMRMRLEAVADPAAQAAVADIHEMNALIDASLAVLREQRDGAAARVVDLQALLQSLVDDLAEQDTAVALATVPAAAATVRVRAHPAALRRIVDNLVGNALRHGGGGARLTLLPAGAQVELWVDDDGPGIPPALVEQAFQPWVRLAADGATARSEPRGGHGLGLAIARDLAERDGGTLTLANRPEGGLRARLVLPAA